MADGESPAMTDGLPGSAGPKERHSLTLDQRRALRRWANSQTVRPSHKACIEWFQQQYGQSISQSTVSHSLSPKYARLDGEPTLSGSRLRYGNWPDVEKLVLLWHQHRRPHRYHARPRWPPSSCTGSWTSTRPLPTRPADIATQCLMRPLQLEWNRGGLGLAGDVVERLKVLNVLPLAIDPVTRVNTIPWSRLAQCRG